MRWLPIVTLVVLGPANAAAAGQPGPPEPIVHVGVFGYRADEGIAVTAYDTQPSANAVVYMRSLCEVGGGSFREPPARATDAWRFSWRILSIGRERAVLEVDWQRILDRGTLVTAPGGVVQLTVQAGGNAVLDHVIPDGPSQCSVARASFEARYGQSPMQPGAPGGTGALNGAATGETARSLRREDRPEPQRSAETGPVYIVNLWLVRSAPGRLDEVLHGPVLATNRYGKFGFPPVTVEARGGPLAVHVSGSLSIESDAKGDQLLFVTERRVSAAAAPAARDRPPDIHGVSRTSMPMPAPDEVLSFEMPPIRLSGRPAVPDQFSVRVQITPRSPSSVGR